VTTAEGMAAPDSSTTVPPRLAVVYWANVALQNANVNHAKARSVLSNFLTSLSKFLNYIRRQGGATRNGLRRITKPVADCSVDDMYHISRNGG